MRARSATLLLVASGLTAAAAPLAVAAVLGAWSVWDIETVLVMPGFFGMGPMSQRIETEWRWTVDGIDASGDEAGSIAYGDMEGIETWPFLLLFHATRAILVVGAIGAAAFGALLVMRRHPRVAALPARLPSVVAVVAAGLLLLAPLLVLVAFPPAVAASGMVDAEREADEPSPERSFWGASREENGEFTWGAGPAWWCAVLAAVASTGALILHRVAARGAGSGLEPAPELAA